MIRNRRRSTAALYLAGDMLAALLAFFAAWFLRFEVGIPALTKGVPDFGVYLRLLPVILVLWPVVFYFHGLYQSRRDRSRVDEALTILLAVVVATVVLSSLQAWFRPLEPGSGDPFTFSRAFMGFYVLSCVAMVIVARVILRHLLQQMRLRGYNLQRILIIGAGALGR
ncbi:MAG: hypothetical protein AAGD38_20875, partial [Acidobacteriota bacterium]